jgi:hypothetical protein
MASRVVFLIFLNVFALLTTAGAETVQSPQRLRCVNGCQVGYQTCWSKVPKTCTGAPDTQKRKDCETKLLGQQKVCVTQQTNCQKTCPVH